MAKLPEPQSWTQALESSFRQVFSFTARHAGKSMLVRQWFYLKVAARHLGDLSQAVAQGALPHSSTATLLAASGMPLGWTQTFTKHYQMPCFAGNTTGILTGLTKTKRK